MASGDTSFEFMDEFDRSLPEFQRWRELRQLLQRVVVGGVPLLARVVPSLLEHLLHSENLDEKRAIAQFLLKFPAHTQETALSDNS